MSSGADIKLKPPPPRKQAREKILSAADELARLAGPGNLSLDAVAARAGVSKGGLLYHFSTKAKLLEALVERFLEGIDRTLSAREAESAGAPDSLVRAYLDILVSEHLCHQPPPSGLLAALGEDPGFLSPVRRFDRRLLDRMKANASDPVGALIVYLTLQGIKSMQLLNIETIDAEEFENVISRLRELVGTQSSDTRRRDRG
jgi:AcrR family transcriptional regulator